MPSEVRSETILIVPVGENTKRRHGHRRLLGAIPAAAKSLLVPAMLSVGGCAHMATDHPYASSGPDAPVEVSAAEIQADPVGYTHAYVVLEGHIDRHAYDPPGRWGFLLTDEQGTGLRCYERNYRREGPFGVRILLRKVVAQAGTLRVAGRVTRDGELELDWVEYGGSRFDTDFAPEPFIFHGHYFDHPFSHPFDHHYHHPYHHHDDHD